MRHGPEGASRKVRTYDLSGAYRQCAVDLDSLQFSYILVAVPGEDRSVAFQMRALPFFKCTLSTRFPQSCSQLLGVTSEFLVPWTIYFDDFVTFADSNEQVSVDAAIKFLLKSLGWRFAESGDKAPPFGELVNALGVSIDVSSMGAGKILIDNTANRKSAISSVISAFIDGGRLPRAEALRLRGRLQFASGQLFGRLAKKAVSVVTEHAYCSKSATLDVETMFGVAKTSSCSPVEISQVFLIFTDACFEPGASSVKAGTGAVLVDSSGKVTHFFAANLKVDLVDDISKSQRKTIIFELELFAILCAVIGWRQFITNCAVVVYTDNDGVRDCLISCNTSSSNARPILDLYLKVEFLFFNAWMSRFPTDSNIADAPSRGDCESLRALGASETDVNVEMVWNDVQEFQMSGGGNDQQRSLCEWST